MTNAQVRLCCVCINIFEPPLTHTTAKHAEQARYEATRGGDDDGGGGCYENKRTDYNSPMWHPRTPYINVNKICAHGQLKSLDRWPILRYIQISAIR